MKKRTIIITAVLVSMLTVVAAIAAVSSNKEQPTKQPNQSQPLKDKLADKQPKTTTDNQKPGNSNLQTPGRYTAHTQDAQKDPSYSTTILFFHASWCPECRAYEKAIEAGTLPDSTQILKVDFDSAGELRSRYKVTLQSTFVSVSSSGEQRTKWVGYGKEKSIQAILENTR